MPALFAGTLFVSATLLFMVQPMVGKMILPLLGGSPAAWNTCMVFFQALLLLGYLYAHRVTTRFDTRSQVRVHLIVLAAAVLWLAGSAIISPAHSPVAVFRSLAPQGQTNPIFGVLGLLAVAIGLPFLVVSTSAPLLQRWFSDTNHPSAKDPYFLYAASNAGSLISLLGYPIVIEPTLTLVQQAWLWTSGYAVLLFLVYRCGQVALHPLPATADTAAPRRRDKKGKPAASAPLAPAADALAAAPPAWTRRLRWLGLAFVPSSLMLGVTFHMTTDIASVPLLWVIPLALYLLTFIIAYARTPDWFRPVLANITPVATLLLVFVLITNVMADDPFKALAVNLVVYFLIALLMHSELARLRPSPAHLTEYFLWISIGGVLGGLFNAIIAPALFTSDYEYPITLAVSCLLIPAAAEYMKSAAPAPDAPATPAPTPDTPAVPAPEPDGAAPPAPRLSRVAAFRRSVPDWVTPLLDVLAPLGMVAVVVVLTGYVSGASWFGPAADAVADAVTSWVAFVGLKFEVPAKTIRLFTVAALPCMLCFLFIDRPVRFGLCVAAVLGVCLFRASKPDDLLWTARSPFGILRVERVSVGGDEYYRLMHGTTLHGMQAATDDPGPLFFELFQPLAAAGPWQSLVVQATPKVWDPRQEPLTYYHRTGPVGWMFRRANQVDPNGHVGMVGLGTGSVAAYAGPGRRLTFYEIDRAVVDLVERGKYFTYVNTAKARGAVVNIELGDARLMLERSDHKYGLLLIDAFSSDSIPVHLLTRESLELYKQRLAPNGILALHISNRYIDLEPVVARLAEVTGLEARVFSDHTEFPPGKSPSSWVALARTPEDLGELLGGVDARDQYGAVAGPMASRTQTHPWRELPVDPNVDAWTDDYSDVLRVMRIPEIKRIRRALGLPLPRE